MGMKVSREHLGLSPACACVCVPVQGVSCRTQCSFSSCLLHIWTAHCTAEFKPLVFEMFTEVLPSKTSKANTGTDP